MKKKNNEKSNFFKNPSFHQNKNVFITNFDGNPKEKFQLKNMVLNKEDPDKIKNKFEVSYDNSKLGTANLKFKKLHYKKIIKIHNSEDKKPNKKELNYQKIRQDNLINQDKIRSKKNQSLMEFAETIDHIINDQRKKINSLVKNVSDKFEDVIKRS